ncbi:hypothetical protein [Azospirillum isscasi]|uniref:Uncharacterized protein n=1 Tax=Azospirillum isscasi TaxID=3053926 RepID=A0ABU0WQV2_9PROT|nr:hypothetical protein [Azospirillum isscasi]MDQ2106619.1 hypothetical protein [Azospirillum isscasi]
MSDALAGVNSMVSGLTDSINSAISALQAQKEQEAAAAANVQEFQKQVNKSSSNLQGQATDIGILAKNVTRLNVVSNLAANDKVDFHRFRVTSKGEATLGRVGDDGLRVQLMTKLGTVIADSNPDTGKDYETFQKLQTGELTLDRGEYAIRVTREKGQSDKETKNYALQLQMGGYTQDYDTVAKQPDKSASPYQMSAAQQAMLSGLNDAITSLSSISYGQSGTDKLLGSFSLFA